MIIVNRVQQISNLIKQAINVAKGNDLNNADGLVDNNSAMKRAIEAIYKYCNITEAKVDGKTFVSLFSLNDVPYPAIVNILTAVGSNDISIGSWGQGFENTIKIIKKAVGL